MADSTAEVMDVFTPWIGGLRLCFARPGKLFTASESIIVRVAAVLTPSTHRSVVEAVVRVVNHDDRDGGMTGS